MNVILKVNGAISIELINQNHAAEIFNLVNDNRKQLRQWLPWVDNMQSVAFITNFIDGSLKRFNEGLEFACVIFYEEQIVGRIGVYQIDAQNKTGAIGYWLAEKFSGKGITTLACRELINHAFSVLDLNRIEIKCGTENFKSQRVAERLNFKKEGIIRQGEKLYDNYIDLCLYSMLKGEWN